MRCPENLERTKIKPADDKDIQSHWEEEQWYLSQQDNFNYSNYFNISKQRTIRQKTVLILEIKKKKILEEKAGRVHPSIVQERRITNGKTDTSYYIRLIPLNMKFIQICPFCLLDQQATLKS